MIITFDISCFSSLSQIFESRFQKRENNLVEVLTSGYPLSKFVITLKL